MGLQQLLDADDTHGNTREGMLMLSEREDIETAIIVLDHLDLIYKILRKQERKVQ